MQGFDAHGSIGSVVSETIDVVVVASARAVDEVADPAFVVGGGLQTHVGHPDPSKTPPNSQL